MKRYGNLFEKITTLENIEEAHNQAKKDKTHYDEVKMVDENPDYYFKQIQEMLVDKTYKIRFEDYKMFEKMDKGKLREIYKLDYFPHRIIQWALLLHTQDIFMETFISNTFSSIPDRGIHLALNKLDKDIKNTDRSKTKYCLKMDIKKFYPSINQQIMSNQLRKKFKDKDVLWLFDEMIFSMDEGIPIGSLASQWLGNYALTPFDHWIKEEKRIKYYYRYADDIVILHHDKEYLHKLKREIDKYLDDNLKLKIKENWQVYPTYVRGIDFVGYRHFGDYVLLRKTTAKTLKRKMSRILRRCEKGREPTREEWSSYNSYKGWIIHCNAFNLQERYMKPLEPYMNSYYEKHVKSKKKTVGSKTRKGDSMKTFAELSGENDKEKLEKLKIADILNKRIVVHKASIKGSKFNKGEKVLTITYTLERVKYISHTTSKVLIAQIENLSSNEEFEARVIKVDKYYKFT